MDDDTNKLLLSLRILADSARKIDEAEIKARSLTSIEFGFMLYFQKLDELLSTSDNPGYLPDDWACSLNPKDEDEDEGTNTAA